MKPYHYKSTCALTAAAMLLLCGCSMTLPGAPQPSAQPETPQNTVQTGSIENTPVRDKTELYASDDPYSVETMYLTVRRGNDSDNTNHSWEELNTHSVYYYDENNLDRFKVEAILQVGDANGPVPGALGYNVQTPNAVVQVRGKTSSRGNQKSYKVRLMKDKGEWREQRTIVLNKHVFDPTRIRNKLSYDLMAENPVLLGARTQFVHLYVKDQTGGDANAPFVDYGLYTQVEQLNTRYLANHGLDRNGQLYKAEMFEFLTYDGILVPKSDERYDQAAFERVLEIKGNDDHTKLTAMLQDLNNAALPIHDVFEKYFDAENYFTWLAFQLLIGNLDITTQNFYLYSPQNSQKWYFISWDNDGAWAYSYNLMRQDTGYNYEHGVSNLWGSVLHQRVMKDPQYRELLDKKINELRASLDREMLAQRVNQYSAAVRPYLTRMPDIQNLPVQPGQLDALYAKLPDEIEYNYQMYLESLSRPMPFYVDAPALVNGKLQFLWNAAYDFDGEDITYRFELARDYEFRNVLASSEGIIIPQAETEMLPPGQYFFRVTAVNASGKEQTAMERYFDVNDNARYGVFMFYVQPDGTIGVG